MTKSQVDWKIVVTGIAALTAIEICALLKGVNGIVLSSVIGIIALAIGVAVPKEKIIGGK